MDPQSCKFCFWDTLCIVKVPVALVVPSEKKSSALPSTMFNHTAWWVFKNKFIHLLIWQKEIRKVFFLEPRHCRLSLLTTPTLIWRHKHSLNVYNTTAWLRMKCLNTQHTPAASGSPKGGRPPTMHLLTPPHLPAPGAAKGRKRRVWAEAGERAGSCAHAPTWHSHTWAPPEERYQGPSAAAAHQERDQSLKGQRAHVDTCSSITLQRTRAPRCVWRKPQGITAVKEMLGKLFDWNITVNKREN